MSAAIHWSSSGDKAPRFRLTAPPVYEQDLHESLARTLRLVVQPPACWTTFPAGNVPLPRADAAKLARLGLQRGWPDVLVLHDGKIYGLEIKKPGGSLSRTRIVRTKRGSPRELVGQTDVFPKLEAAGMTIGIVHSVEEALNQLFEWQIPLRWKPSETRL